MSVFYFGLIFKNMSKGGTIGRFFKKIPGVPPLAFFLLPISTKGNYGRRSVRGQESKPDQDRSSSGFNRDRNRVKRKSGGTGGFRLDPTGGEITENRPHAGRGDGRKKKNTKKGQIEDHKSPHTVTLG